MNVRAKFNALLLGTVIPLAVLLCLLLLYLVRTQIVDRAQGRMDLAIRTAWRGIDERREDILEALRCSVRADRPVDAAWMNEQGLDFAASVNGASRTNAPLAQWLFDRYLAGRAPNPVSGFALIPHDIVAADSPALAARCRTPRNGLENALMLFAALPMEGGKDEPQWSIGGRLLNGATTPVEELSGALFPETTYAGKPVGTVTVFAGPVRVATTVVDRDGRRAVGTTVSDEVARRVLEGGLPWSGRANVVGEWYLSRYDPLRDPGGRVVGMLYIGELERIYRDLRMRLLASGLGAIAIVTAMVYGLGVLLARCMLRQSRELVRATQAFAAGDYAVRAPVLTRDELGEIAAAFNEMAARIEEDRRRMAEQAHAVEEANRGYIDLLSFVTHELRSSLASAMFNVDLMSQGDYGALTDDLREGVAVIADTLRRLDDLTFNYLQLSRIEAGHTLIDRKEVPLRKAVVEPVLKELDARIRHAEMRVENRIESGLVVAGDEALLRTVFMNVLGNAVKYGRHGGCMDLWSERREGHAELHVRNEGRGIPADRLEAVFERFRHFDVDEETGRAGTGVGLFVSRQIVRQHGGDMWAVSQPGAYAELVFTLLT